MLKHEMITLTSLDGGALQELFAAELPRLLDNIIDPNTKADALREVNITIKVKPTKSRNEADVSYGVRLKLAPQNERTTTIYLTTDQAGGRIAAEYPQNLELEVPPLQSQEETGEEPSETTGNVIDMRRD